VLEVQPLGPVSSAAGSNGFDSSIFNYLALNLMVVVEVVLINQLMEDLEVLVLEVLADIYSGSATSSPGQGYDGGAQGDKLWRWRWWCCCC
jgi:uncharacterized transporter YbjL